MYHGQHKSSDVLADVRVRFVEERLKRTYSRYNERLFSSLGTRLLLCWRENTKDEDSADREGARRVKRGSTRVLLSRAFTPAYFNCHKCNVNNFCGFVSTYVHFNKKINDKKLTRRLDELCQ